ncbi:HAMP domain-containing histidine kinase [bacterium]|nr:HAMP domain-containing histidine kinase [bacterium]
MKNKFLIFLPLLFSFFLFLFVCFNFTDSNILGHSIEKETSFFADAGSFKADLDSLDSLASMYEKSEENALPNDFLQTKIQSVISRNAAFIKNESGERLSARIEDFSAKIAAKGEELAEAPAEEKPRIIASLRTDISTLKDMADLAAKQKLGILQYSYFVWQDFINKTVIAVSALFLLINVILTVLLLKKRKSVAGLLSLIGLGENASASSAAEEIKKLTEAKSAELDEIGKKFAREQIVGKRKEDLLNAIPEGLSAAASGRVTFVNRTMKDWFGVDGSFIGEEMKTVFDKVGTDGKEGKFVNGEETYQLSVSLGQNETFYIIRNITKSEELSSKLLNSERLASIGEMAARITHEIRNPLNTIKMNSDYLLENIGKTEPEEKKQLLSLVVKEVERLEQITNEYMGKVNYNKNGANDSGVSVPTDLVEFLSFHLPELKQRNIELTVGKCEPLSISISLSSFKEIMLNLLKNAWEELENGGKIAVNIGKNGNFAVISVEDSGRGVPQSERETIFKNFYTKKPGGTGIGLSHSRKLATEAGGKLYVGDSTLGGAAFVLEIPIRRKSA